MKTQINSFCAKEQVPALNSFSFAQQFLLKILLFLVIFPVIFLKMQATEPDTVWTRNLGGLGTYINQVQFLPDGQNIAVAVGGGVYILDIKTGQIVKQFKKYMSSCNSFILTNDGKLITVADDNLMIIWNYITGDTIRKFSSIHLRNIKYYDNNSVIGIGFSVPWNPDSTMTYIVDINSGNIINRLPSPDKSMVITAFAVNRINNLFSIVSVRTSGEERYIELWDLIQIKRITTLGYHTSQVNDLAFSSDGKYLASASSDGIIKVWDIVNKQIIKSLNFDDKLNNPFARYLMFSLQNGYLIAGGGIFGNLSTKIWRLSNFEQIFSYQYGATYGLDINSDSTLIAAGSGNQLILLNAHWSPFGIEEPKDKVVRTLFPNPAGNQITIPLEKEGFPISLKISDINGRVILTINNIESFYTEIKVNITSFIPGIYFVSVVYPQRSVTYKFEKIR